MTKQPWQNKTKQKSFGSRTGDLVCQTILVRDAARHPVAVAFLILIDDVHGHRSSFGRCDAAAGRHATRTTRKRFSVWRWPFELLEAAGIRIEVLENIGPVLQFRI